MHDPIYNIGFSSFAWYLKSINEIDILKMDFRTSDNHQIAFSVSSNEHRISLTSLYPTYPKIFGFEILQFIANLAYQCTFSIDVIDVSDISTIYSALYGKNYYEYHFKGVDLKNHNFLFQNIIVKKKTFLDCFEKQIGYLIKFFSQLFYKNIKICENSFLPVEYCPITFSTHRIFYKESFEYCIDWSRIGGFPRIIPRISNFFKITSKDMTRIMKKNKQFNINNFVKINLDLQNKTMKTYDDIKTQIFDTSFLMKLFSKSFQLCFFELEKIKSNPNPEDIFKLYLRPCVIPNINLFLKYYTDII